uniref:NACHT domain-containing protein n=1 Tax=Salarias fasciatus TaxID=181472 RepID=A0A672JSM1_SALFA
HHVEQALTPAQSYKSMASDGTNTMDDDNKSYTGYSGDTAAQRSLISDTLKKLARWELRDFKTKLWGHFPELFYASPEHVDLVNLVDRLLECYSLEASLQITKTVLAELKLTAAVDSLWLECVRNQVRYELREILKEKYAEADVGGEKRPFDEIYTDPRIYSKTDFGPNIEHEVATIPKLSTNKSEPKLITLNDIHAPENVDRYDLQFVLVTGMAGSGKSMLVQRLILDWSHGRSHQHVTFLFPLTFRELKKFAEGKVSLLSIINELYPPTTKLKFEDISKEDCKVMWVFDGLDEFSGKIDFFNTELYGAYPDPTSLNVIVVNLLRGRILFHGLILVTTRSQVKRTIPYDVHCWEVQLQGFSEPQKDEYFTKRFKDEAQAARVISHVKSLKTFHIMCHLPLFCSLIADECQRAFTEQGSQAELPKSLTNMYTKLMLLLMRQLRSFRAPGRTADEERDFLMDTGKMAFTMLEKGAFLLDKSYEWEQHGVSDREVVDYSGFGTEFYIKPMILYREKAFSFIHPTMQEYIAALYVFLSFTNQGKMIFERQLKSTLKGIFKGSKIMELYKSALERNLKCEDAKMDFFLRFLFGMSARENLELLAPICNTSQCASATSDAAALIRKRMRDGQHPDRMRNLEHCLEELGVCDPSAETSNGKPR